ncbi:hypothetical protein JCM18899A_41760 [Nocardioides sp. AN3]
MAYVMLYGVGWTQRWQVAEGAISAIENEISRVGLDETGHLAVLDPASGEPTTLVVAWRHVAAAIVLGSAESMTSGDTTTGPYR